MPLPSTPLQKNAYKQQNPTLDKVGISGTRAGAETRSIILREYSGRIVVDLEPGEELLSIAILLDGDISMSLPISWEYLPGTAPDGGRRAWAFIPYAEKFFSATETTRNVIQVTTDRGVSVRQVWVGTGSGLFVNNIDATQRCVHLYVDKDVRVAETYSIDVTLSINILPYTNDEFFKQQAYPGNRWCNTLRNAGGTATATVFLDGLEVIPETEVFDIHGYYWQNPSLGFHAIMVHLRPEWGSRYYKEIIGQLRVRNIPGRQGCPV